MRKMSAGIALALIAVLLVYAMGSFLRENWAANQVPGPLEGFWYVVFIAPQSVFQSWQPSFQRMLDSVRFPP
ncbi:MAG: hypothetical protein HY316_05555 [Acidobacteria bacterium]|nr:hypothetical protein [Acidobacteriota bacterium]